jgi:hypothetical protein
MPANGRWDLIRRLKVKQQYNGIFLIMKPTIAVAAFHPDPARKLSANLYDIYHCCVYSDKLLMMDRGTVRNM